MQTLTPRATTSMSTRSAMLLIAATLVGLVHQVDHILRYDHSGWPFRPEVSPFTFSWLLFGLGLLPFVIRRRPWLRLVPVGLLLALVQTAHIVIETPRDQYRVWATGVSTEPDALGHSNLLGITSPLVGYLAAGIALAVTALLTLSLLSLAQDAAGTSRR